MGPQEIDERFDGRNLDEQVWTASYLPAWSSRMEAAATYRLDADGLHLSIPPEQPLWCPDLHDGPLRVSAVQSGNFSGPVGSSHGQQAFRPGLLVREQQPTRWGFTPHYGRIEVECRATLTPSSMFSAWMVGLEHENPDDNGEITLVEVFGDNPAGLGHGIKAIRDPRLHEEFHAGPHPVDVSRNHRYAVHWQPDSVSFYLDGELLRTVEQAPQYPMQLIIAVFDFPGRAPATEVVPELVVRAVTGHS
ncbi:glycoside hydrolase family 16 protein [Kineosporia babensis]|uniref:Glycoside hydrolase family 16 protein n=1 Tax=Kineosporia babensis TaxID=499548 RepID=A0A9X1NDB1_9ACTN|nr:glycoside hydrolase family 16 protein [Kineosporia babensis]MCD5312877.1 glycoside hydrolase family 16 protein [Kineosporia babensis]